MTEATPETQGLINVRFMTYKLSREKLVELALSFEHLLRYVKMQWGRPLNENVRKHLGIKKIPEAVVSAMMDVFFAGILQIHTLNRHYTGEEHS